MYIKLNHLVFLYYFLSMHYVDAKLSLNETKVVYLNLLENVFQTRREVK